MRRWLVLSLVLVACTQPQPMFPEHDTAQRGELGAEEGLPAYRRWSERVAQGGQPTAVGFQRLQAEGFRTVISVDGALPDVEAAARFGLRTIHVPVGYAGIPREAALRIVKGATAGPVYIHCHHGRHRGPAAAMLARIALDGVSPEQATLDLRDSGCSPDYGGLYRVVATFEPPGGEELEDVTDLPSGVPPEGLQSQMVDIDAIWGRLLAIERAGWTTPADHPDVTPRHEALLLRERFRELARTEEVRAKGEAFGESVLAAEAAAQALERNLAQQSDPASSFDAVRQRCVQCHKRYRDAW